MSVFDEPKIDCHVHVFDPARFRYAPDTFYAPGGQEVGTAAQLRQVFDAYGVRYGVAVGPNSGYGSDSRCLLDAISGSDGRLKGMAVVGNDVSRAELERLRAAGVLGVTFNAATLGLDHYRRTSGLLSELVDLDLLVDVQVEADQLASMAALLRESGPRILVDHCGRPVPEAGPQQPGFQALLDLAGTGRVFVKLSGQVKFARQPYPYADTWPYLRALIDTFGPDRCLWASDWPFLRAPERVDYGPLLRLVEHLLPDPADRRAVLWDTPRRLFGFGALDPDPATGAPEADCR